METIKNLNTIVENSINYSDVVKNCGLDLTCGNRQIIKKQINYLNIDISHFKVFYKNSNNFNKKQTKDILIENSNFNRCHLKERLYKEGLKERKCELCGQGEEWCGNKMGLILDHINGIHNDNRIENLRIVCPNCNATLDTHCGKNKNKNYFYEKIKTYCECGNEMSYKSKRCIICEQKNNKKVKDRPSLVQLNIDVKELGYRGTGRKYGVSDNCIRKWIKLYSK